MINEQKRLKKEESWAPASMPNCRISASNGKFDIETDYVDSGTFGKIIVFAKEPVAGKVKTRLACSIGDEAALRFHEKMLCRTMKTVCEYNRAKVELHVSGNLNHPLIRSLSEQFDVPLKAQQGEDLGEKMYFSLQQSLLDSQYSVLIGTDCPAMTVDYLANAFTALSRGQDAVLGPAEDGGYVLIGTRRPRKKWFEGIAWGTASVFEQSRQKIQSMGGSLEELQTLWDVDQVEDFKRWQLQAESGCG